MGGGDFSPCKVTVNCSTILSDPKTSIVLGALIYLPLFIFLVRLLDHNLYRLAMFTFVDHEK